MRCDEFAPVFIFCCVTPQKRFVSSFFVLLLTLGAQRTKEECCRLRFREVDFFPPSPAPASLFDETVIDDDGDDDDHALASSSSAAASHSLSVIIGAKRTTERGRK